MPASGALDVSQQLSSTAAGVGVSAASRAFGSDDAPLVSCGGGAGVGVSSAVPSAVGGDSTAPISRPPGEIIPIGGLPVVTPVSPQVAPQAFASAFGLPALSELEPFYGSDDGLGPPVATGNSSRSAVIDRDTAYVWRPEGTGWKGGGGCDLPRVHALLTGCTKSGTPLLPNGKRRPLRLYPLGLHP